MSVPQRYKDLIDYFESLQIAGELLDEERIDTIRHKSKSHLQFNVKTALGETAPYEEKNMYFNKADFNSGTMYYYFSFLVQLERAEDNVMIFATIPKIAVDSSGERVWQSKIQIRKMIENGFVYDLRASGYDEVKLVDALMSFEIQATLSKNQSVTEISAFYDIIKKYNKKAFESLKY